MTKLNGKKPLKTSSPAEAERFITAGLEGKQRSTIQHAFRLSAAALVNEPREWPAQLIARLREERTRVIRRIVSSVSQSVEGCWLKPIRTALIAARGPIDKISDVGAPLQHGKSLIWSQDRRTLTFFSCSSIRTWNLVTGREIRRIELPIEWGLAAIANPPRRAVVTMAQRQLLLVNLKTAAAETIFDGGVIEMVAISADGAWAVATSVPPDWDYLAHDGDGPRTLRLFDLRRRQCVRTWQAHGARIDDLALNADGRFLATVSRDRTARLFDLRNGRTLCKWRGRYELAAVAITPSGNASPMSQGGANCRFVTDLGNSSVALQTSPPSQAAFL
jgi:WD40 domain-containing protein